MAWRSWSWEMKVLKARTAFIKELQDNTEALIQYWYWFRFTWNPFIQMDLIYVCSQLTLWLIFYYPKFTLYYFHNLLEL